MQGLVMSDKKKSKKKCQQIARCKKMKLYLDSITKLTKLPSVQTIKAFGMKLCTAKSLNAFKASSSIARVASNKMCTRRMMKFLMRLLTPQVEIEEKICKVIKIIKKLLRYLFCFNISIVVSGILVQTWAESVWARFLHNKMLLSAERYFSNVLFMFEKNK